MRSGDESGEPCGFDGKRVLVLGLGRFGGGVGVTRWLVGEGAEVTITDQAQAEALSESLAAISDLKVQLHLGGHDLSDLDRTDVVIVNPAVNKRRSEFFQEIEARRLPWTTELNLFCERCPAPVLGVTGTFGKSTTCAMLAEALAAAVDSGAVGFTRVHFGGNIGRSLLGDLPDIGASDLVVLEISSAQLEDVSRIDWAPWIAVITNLEPHHLDRYATYADYVRTKLNIIGPPSRTAWVIVGSLDAEGEKLLQAQTGDANERIRRVSMPASPVELRVPGAHNQRNAACVLAVGERMGLKESEARTSLARFRGLEHRIEYVRTIDGVDYFNDSKSTSPVTTAAAIEAFNRPLVVIVGGQRKDVAWDKGTRTLQRLGRTIICFGEAGPVFAQSFRGQPDLNGAVIVEASTLAQSVTIARKAAKPGDAVLFSPGAPSFDAYANYAERGQHFRALVGALS